VARPALRIVTCAELPADLVEEAGSASTARQARSWTLYAGDELAGAVSASDTNDCCIALLYVRPAWRGLGYGSEAVAAVVDALRQDGAERVRVVAPKGNGLSVYFWFRQGFRPERADERGLFLVRDLS
jgi:GNAT superfamily N-acetyltransferase